MAVRLREVSTTTAKGQTTVPKSIRQALGVDFGGRIAFHLDEHGVSARREESEEANPAIESFLTFLARDLEASPEAIASPSQSLMDRIGHLTRGMTVDLDEPIDGDVDL